MLGNFNEKSWRILTSTGAKIQREMEGKGSDTCKHLTMVVKNQSIER